MTSKAIEPIKWMTAEDWHADRRKHFGEHAVEQMKAQEAEARAFGERHGYGRMMQLAQQEWRAKLGGLAGGEFAVGPCTADLVICGCRYNRNPDKPHCDWCLGAGWLTRRVREAQIQADNTFPAGDSCA